MHAILCLASSESVQLCLGNSPRYLQSSLNDSATVGICHDSMWTDVNFLNPGQNASISHDMHTWQQAGRQTGRMCERHGRKCVVSKPRRCVMTALWAPTWKMSLRYYHDKGRYEHLSAHLKRTEATKNTKGQIIEMCGTFLRNSLAFSFPYEFAGNINAWPKLWRKGHHYLQEGEENQS